MASATLEYTGLLVGHSNRVTSIATPWVGEKRVICSSSRDGSVIVWSTDETELEAGHAGKAIKRLTKHQGEVADVVMDHQGDYCLTSGVDKTLKLWAVDTGKCFRTMAGHGGGVASGALSADTRQIVSGSADGSIKVWNTLGHCKFTLPKHADRVKCVRFSPVADKFTVVSCGLDGIAKVWDLKTSQLIHELHGHVGPIDSVVVSPDGSLCATGGRDGQAILWDLDGGKHLYSLEAGSPIVALCFSPCNYWLCAATENGIKIWDLEKKKILSDIRMVACSSNGNDTSADIIDLKRIGANKEVIPMMHFEERRQRPSKHLPWVTSLTWSPSGDRLYAGSYTGEIFCFSLRNSM